MNWVIYDNIPLWIFRLGSFCKETLCELSSDRSSFIHEVLRDWHYFGRSLFVSAWLTQRTINYIGSTILESISDLARFG